MYLNVIQITRSNQAHCELSNYALSVTETLTEKILSIYITPIRMLLKYMPSNVPECSASFPLKFIN